MKALKLIGLFLLALLVIFMIKGMILGAMFFFLVLRLACYAAIVAAIVYFYLKLKK